MKILICGVFKFPYGSAAATRLRLMGLAFMRAGFAVEIVGVGRNSGTAVAGVQSGEFGGCKYTMIGLPSGRGAGVLVGLARFWFCVTRKLECERPDVLLTINQDFFMSAPCGILATVYKALHVIEAVEWFRSVDYRRAFVNPLYWNHVLGSCYARCFPAGVISISSLIAHRIKRFDQKTLIVPSLIDDTGPIASPPVAGPMADVVNILYIGTLKPTDCPEEMVRGIQYASREGVPVILSIVGISKGDALTLLPHLAELMCVLTDRGIIKWEGRLSEAEYQQRIQSADALILLRGSDERTMASFPTRLSEIAPYGKIVISTAVPDIPFYFDDRVHMHLIAENSRELIHQRLYSILHDRSLSVQMCSNFMKQARTRLGISFHGARMRDFLMAAGACNLNVTANDVI